MFCLDWTLGAFGPRGWSHSSFSDAWAALVVKFCKSGTWFLRYLGHTITPTSMIRSQHFQHGYLSRHPNDWSSGCHISPQKELWRISLADWAWQCNDRSNLSSTKNEKLKRDRLYKTTCAWCSTSWSRHLRLKKSSHIVPEMLVWSCRMQMWCISKCFKMFQM